jgi:hypothetical protein
LDYSNFHRTGTGFLREMVQCNEGRCHVGGRNKLAKLLCVSAPYLGGVLRGEKPMTEELAEKVAQAASLVGLAPLARDSGKTHGKRSIRGGRPRAKRALYMPALNAIRCNPEFKAKYEAMIKAGKPTKVAIVAIKRKLLILANALIRGQRKWAPAAP